MSESEQTTTERVRLEEETRITARSHKPLRVEVPVGDEITEMVVRVKPLPFECLEDTISSIAKLVAASFRLAASATTFQVAVSPSPEGFDARSAGAGDSPESKASAERVEGKAKLAFESLFDEKTFTGIAFKARDVIKDIIELGTDKTWDDVKKIDFFVVVQIALWVFKHNAGPELRSFLFGDVKEIMGALIEVKEDKDPEKKVGTEQKQS